MNWFVDLVTSLAVPAAGALGAFWGGRAVVKSQSLQAEASAHVAEEQHRRDRADELENDMRSRAEALVLAVTDVRALPIGTILTASRGLADTSPPTVYETNQAKVNAVFASLIVRFPEVMPAADAVRQLATPGGHDAQRFMDSAAVLSRAIDAAVDVRTTAK